MIVYIIVTLLILLAILLDYVFNSGEVYLINTKEELLTALILMLIPVVNIYCLYKILKAHRTK